jgi:hypothetical protein
MNRALKLTTIQDDVAQLGELAAPSAPSRYTLKKRLAVFVHDCIAHPLTWLTRDARWAWRLHDWSGEVASEGHATAALRISGRGSGEAVRILTAHGFVVSGFYPDASEIKSPHQGTGGYLSRTDRAYNEELARARAREQAHAEAVGDSRTAARDLVAGDSIAHGGEWCEIASVRHEGPRVSVRLHGDDEIKCGGGRMFRVRE